MVESLKNNLILTQCFPPVIGGIENYMAGLAATLAQHQPTTVFADIAKGVSDAKQPYHVRRFSGVKFLRRRYKGYRANNLVRNGNGWRVFCDSWKSLEYFNPPPNTPVFVFAHGTEFPLKADKQKYSRIEKSLKKATRILANSDATRQRMQSLNFNINKIEVWHPPISKPPPIKAEAEANLIKIWGNSHPRLVTVARLTERKGIGIAIESIAKLRGRYPNIGYFIAGCGAQEEKLHSQIKQLNLGDSVRLLGAISETKKSALLSTADAFILPCYPVGDDIEGYGMVFVEAAYFGVPSVAGRAGGSAEAVGDNVTGIVCNGTDINAVCGAIERLLAPQNYAKLSENCRQKGQHELWQNRIVELID